MGIYSKQEQPANNVQRNSFDRSFTNHLTTNFGRLSPVCCFEALPKSTFEIDSSFGLQFMPTVFPVQSKIDAKIDFFYVRNRVLWKDWTSFQFDTKKNLVHPYITPKKESMKVGSLYDYFDVPVVRYGSYGSGITSNPHFGFISGYNSSTYEDYVSIAVPYSSYDPSASSSKYISDTLSTDLVALSFSPSGPNDIAQILYQRNFYFTDHSRVLQGVSPSQYLYTDNFNNDDKSSPHCGVGQFIYSGFQPGDELSFALSFVDSEDGSRVSQLLASPDYKTFICVVYFNVADNSKIEFAPESTVVREKFNPDGFRFTFTPPSGYSHAAVLVPFGRVGGYPSSLTHTPNPIGVSIMGSSDSSTSYAEISDPSVPNPFVSVNGNKPKLALSALPFRAYEMIYNSFYRDMRNNPYYPNGTDEEPEYDQYLPTIEGGPDNNNYELHYHNWEQDHLTTAQFSPQFGEAPLVGVSSTGTLTFRDEKGDTYDVQSTLSDDGDTIESVSYRQNLPQSVARSLVNVATSGISINDFRNVNSYQRWLEMHLRRGLKYKDLLKSEWDVDASYNVLDMPEFIGGVKVTVDANKVNQTSEGSLDSPLGSFAGQMSCLAQAKHKVKCYCDESGFIIGILSVRPTPSYSQLLPKYFLKSDPLDYYNYEFRHIGMQPIRYSEVCPVQAFNDPSGDATDEIFGYQRAWYDYVSSVDTVHGLMRTQLRNFLINRVFDEKPVLSPDFLVMNDKHLNDIFSVTETTDKIMGKIVFDVKAVLPIPRYIVPRLE